MGPVLADLHADFGALRSHGVDAARAPVYRAFLEIGTIADLEERDLAVEDAITAADLVGEIHLRVLIRLVALALLTGRQRELVDELMLLVVQSDDPA